MMKSRWTGRAIAAIGAITATAKIAQRRAERDLDHARASARSGARRMRGRVRDLGGRLQGLGYRMQGRRPDPNVDDETLAQRVRSELGPVLHRLDLPRVTVDVEEGVATVTGVVASETDSAIIERAVLDVSGVRIVAPRLTLGLSPSDTRPSAGRANPAPSAALRELLGAVRALDTGDDEAVAALTGVVLNEFLAIIPEGERRHIEGHLPVDVRDLCSTATAAPPGRRLRDAGGLFAAVGGATGRSPATAEAATRAVLASLRLLVPEETADVGAVLPGGLKDLWRAPLVTPAT